MYRRQLQTPKSHSNVRENMRKSVKIMKNENVDSKQPQKVKTKMIIPRIPLIQSEKVFWIMSRALGKNYTSSATSADASPKFLLRRRHFTPCIKFFMKFIEKALSRWLDLLVSVVGSHVYGLTLTTSLCVVFSSIFIFFHLTLSADGWTQP